MQKILIPTDFSEIAREAARYAKKYVAANDAEFYVLHAYNQPDSNDMLISIVDILKEESDKMLNDEAAFLQKELGIPSDRIFLICLFKISSSKFLGDLGLFFFINGWVASSRLATKSHSISELIIGFFIGALPQVVILKYWL